MVAIFKSSLQNLSPLLPRLKVKSTEHKALEHIRRYKLIRQYVDVKASMCKSTLF